MAPAHGISIGFTMLLAFTLGAATQSAGAEAQPPCAECVVLTITPTQVEALTDGLNRLHVLLDLVGGSPDRAAELLESIRRHGGRPGVLLAPGAPHDPVPRIVGAETIVLAVPPGEPDEVAFALKIQLTALRAAAPSAAIGISGSPAALSALVAHDLAPYVDLVIAPGVRAPMPDVRWWRRADLVVDAAAAIEASRTPPAERWVWTAPTEPTAFRRLVGDLSRAAAILPTGLVPSPEVTLRCGTRGAETWLNPASLDHVGWLPECPVRAVAIPAGHTLAERIDFSSGHVLIRLSSDAGDRFSDDVQVSAARQLTIEEVIARHQAALARQAATVKTLVSTGTLTVTFEAPGFSAPVTISSESVIYTDDRHTDIEQRNILVNGLAFRGRGVPRLPLLEPERVASPPLAIVMSDVYRYMLEGTETLNGTLCYVVAFEPAVHGRSLFRGRAWIAADSFAMVRVSAAQTSLRGPIVSSEQIDEFRLERDGIWLLARSDVRQLYEGAAHRTPIRRVLVVAAHDINAPEFVERRASAYASAQVLIRDTPQGFRYLQREEGKDKESGPEAAVEPLVARSNRVRTVVAGVLIDPNISRPLPFAGLSYVDFDLLGTGTQLSGFFGGSYGQLAVAVPSLGGTRWQLGSRAFAIASEFHDRAFVDGRERHEENIRQRPAHASIWLVRPLTPRLSLRAGYEFDYTHFRRAESTAAGFVVPAHQAAHGLRLALEGQRAGWNLSAWWNPAVRSGWREWGHESHAEFHPRHTTFQRYGVSATRAAVLSPTLVARAEASWMDGADLDRFSRYAFGAFDNRLRGYPAALIRYDRGAALRGVAAWSLAHRVRLDGFVDNALVQDPGFGTGFRRFTGLGAAVEAAGPLGTLITAEWGFGIDGVNASGSRGTHVLRLSAWKIF